MLLFDTKHVLKTQTHCITREFVVGVLSEFPGALLAITRDRLGTIVGADIGQTHVGVMCLDPWNDRPVSWQDVDGIPHWRANGKASTGSYRSEVITADRLLELLP